MFESEIAHLAFDPRAIDGDGAHCWAEGCDNSGDHSVVKLDAADLSEHRLLPSLLAEPRMRAPGVARVRMELAVAAIGKRAVAADASAADAFEQPSEQVDTPSVTRTGASELGPPDILDPGP
jgi:hypothetical protein